MFPRHLPSALYFPPFALTNHRRKTSPVRREKSLAIGRVWKNTVRKEVELNVLRHKFYLLIYLFFTHLIFSIFSVILLIFDIFRYAHAYVRTGCYAPVLCGGSVVDRHLKVVVLPNRNGETTILLTMLPCVKTGFRLHKRTIGRDGKSVGKSLKQA